MLIHSLYVSFLYDLFSKQYISLLFPILYAERFQSLLLCYICGRPQTINEQSDFGDMVVKAAVQCCNKLQEQGTDVVLLNTAVDGVSCESHFCRRQISSFLEGKSNILGLVDPNHNAKNS